LTGRKEVSYTLEEFNAPVSLLSSLLITTGADAQHHEGEQISLRLAVMNVSP
jgi:hypothetical protein